MGGRAQIQKERHLRFIDAYLETGIARQAAIAAGYSQKRADATGSELLKRPDIAAAIREAQDERAERLGIDQDWVVEKARIAVEKSLEGTPKIHRGEPVMVNGEVVRSWSPSGVAANLGIIAKVLGLGAPERREVEVSGEVVYTLNIDQRPPALDVEAIEVSE